MGGARVGIAVGIVGLGEVRNDLTLRRGSASDSFFRLRFFSRWLLRVNGFMPPVEVEVVNAGVGSPDTTCVGSLTIIVVLVGGRGGETIVSGGGMLLVGKTGVDSALGSEGPSVTSLKKPWVSNREVCRRGDGGLGLSS